jgi:hypothetical protein
MFRQHVCARPMNATTGAVALGCSLPGDITEVLILLSFLVLGNFLQDRGLIHLPNSAFGSDPIRKME